MGGGSFVHISIYNVAVYTKLPLKWGHFFNTPSMVLVKSILLKGGHPSNQDTWYWTTWVPILLTILCYRGTPMYTKLSQSVSLQLHSMSRSIETWIVLHTLPPAQILNGHRDIDHWSAGMKVKCRVCVGSTDSDQEMQKSHTKSYSAIQSPKSLCTS